MILIGVDYHPASSSVCRYRRDLRVSIEPQRWRGRAFPDRFACGKKIGSYLGLIPEEGSNGDITKQGSSLVRYLLTEAAQAAVRCDPTGDVATSI